MSEWPSPPCPHCLFGVTDMTYSDPGLTALSFNGKGTEMESLI